MSKPLTIKEVKNRILKSHGIIVTLDATTYKNLRTKAKFIDSKFGEFWAQPHHVIYGHGHPKRGIINSHENKILPVEIVKSRLNTVHGNEIILDETTYVSMHSKARFIDKDYGAWWATPANVLQNHKHEKRSRVESASKISKTRKAKIASGEINKWEWLLASKFEHTDIECSLEEEFRNRNISFEAQKVLFNKFMPDFVNEEFKIVVFADGCYWHGCMLHNLGFKKASQRQSIDKSQTTYLTKCGYKVFRFWEHDIKKDVKICVDEIEKYIEGLL